MPGPGRPRGEGLSPTRAEPERLRRDLLALEGERHPESSPEGLEGALGYVEAELRSAGLDPWRDPFSFQGRTHENVAARLPASDPDAPRVLVGAHVDTVRGSPGADDNGSGVAALLECGRLLAGRTFRAPVELVAFNLEEQQVWTYRVGSRRWAARARREGVRYAGALVFEMVGYTSTREGSQRIPALVRWRDIPRTGDFLAVVGDWKSKGLIDAFREGAEEAAPGLRVVTHRTPCRGWIVWQTRLSDNASFWSAGYPALMITDTAFLRNPHYHRASDRADTLDYAFMARVVDAAVATVEGLAGEGVPRSRRRGGLDER